MRKADNVIQSIGSLLQRDNKSTVQVMSKIQALASQLITPGVSGSFNSALTAVISEIEQNVESKLIAAFESMQSEVDSAIARLEASTTIVVDRKTTADDADNSWFDCVRSEKAMLEEVEQADRDLQSARDSVTEPCQLQQDRTVFEKNALDLPTFTCDHSESGNCDAQVHNFEIQVGSMLDGLTNDMTAQQELYNEAKIACDAAHADVVAKQSAHASAVGEFQAKKVECALLHESRQLALCLFGTGLQDKCKEASMYLDTMTKIDQSANELSLSDLQAEWETTYVVKCILLKVLDGGSFDEVEAADAPSTDPCAVDDESCACFEHRDPNYCVPCLQDSTKCGVCEDWCNGAPPQGVVSECEGAVNFEQQVGQLDRKQAAYDGLTTADKFTCSEETITFRGQTWEVNGPTSSDYAMKDWSPAVSLPEGSPPFTFCPE